jgi:predicted DNA-binding protein (MmcQ/YjbR family)
MAKRESTRDRIRAFALALPEAFEDHPWGEDVIKAAGKVFVFLGTADHDAGPGMGVKLTDSHAQALMVRGAEPSGYGLGKSGRVNVPFARGGPPVDVLTDWVEESYRLVAPKRNAKALDEARQDKPKRHTKKAGVR